MAPHQARVPGNGGTSGLLRARKDGVSMKRSGNAQQARPQMIATALVAEQEGGGGWIGSGGSLGVMHSASRLLAHGATLLFNAMFKPRIATITAPPPAPFEKEKETEETEEEEVPPLEMEQPVENEKEEELTERACTAPTSNNVQKGAPLFAKLENILKEKDLTREECERYIELIQSKVADDEPQTDISPWRRVNFKDQESIPPRGMSQALTVKKEVSPEDFRPRELALLVKETKASESEVITRSGRWTPIQRPITGGKEFLKKRPTALDESPASRPLNLRGPTFIRSPALKRKPEIIDLTCFRKTTNSKPPLRLDVPSVPRQSSRTARTILNTMGEKTPFKDLPRGPEFRRKVPSEVSLPPRATTTSGVSGFSFPWSAQGPEPPTPKPIPSPYTPIKPSDHLDGSSNVKNGLLPSFQLKSDLATFNLDKMVERVERASSLLGGSSDAAPSVAISPSFSNVVVNGIGSFETGSSSRGDDRTPANPFERSTTGTSLTSGITKATTAVETSKETFLFNVPEQNSMGPQSLAPPDISSPHLSNGNGLPSVEKVSKRRKSAKRLK